MKKLLMGLVILGLSIAAVAEPSGWTVFEAKGKTVELVGEGPSAKVVSQKVNFLFVLGDDAANGVGYSIGYMKGGVEMGDISIFDVTNYNTNYNKGAISIAIDLDGPWKGNALFFGKFSTKDGDLKSLFVKGSAVGEIDVGDDRYIDTAATMTLRFNRKLTEKLLGASLPDVQDVLVEYLAKKTKLDITSVRGMLAGVIETRLLESSVAIHNGINAGTDPDFGAYSLTVGSFHMDQYEVSNDSMVKMLQWAYDQGKLVTTSSSVKNAQGDQRELLYLNQSECRITWDGSSFAMKADKGSGYPCVMVTWYGAAAYCNYRSEEEGRTPCYDLSTWACNTAASGYRLPSYVEWEYAARGGSEGNRFPSGATINHSDANYRANGSALSYDTSPYTSGTYHPDYDDDGKPYTSPKGSFPANGYGLFDMAGNVWEWCDAGTGSPEYICGGSWGTDAASLRCWVQGWSGSDTVAGTKGFRACRSGAYNVY